MRTRQDLFVVIQVLGHGDQMILDVGEIETLCKDDVGHMSVRSGLKGWGGGRRTDNIGFRRDAPILIATFRETFDHIRLVTHQS